VSPALARWTGRLASGSLAIAAAMLGIMAAVVIYTVFQRYLLGRTPYWSEELPRLVLIWMAFLGAVAAAVHGGHLSAGLLPLLVRGERVLWFFAVLRLALTALFSIVMIKASFDLALLTSGQLTAALQISASWAYAACAVGFAGLAVVSVSAILMSKQPE
jgi:TRAP-type C4-dicarboxylate transport system permease small subunit